jgi:hypothetical protein
MDRKRKLTRKQELELKQMGERERRYYLMSLLGIHPQRMTLPRRYEAKLAKPDKLSTKNKLGILALNSRSLNLDMSHAPLKTSTGLDMDAGYWIGVEIECFIPWSDGNHFDNGQMRYELKEALRRAKIPRCTVKQDGSLNSEDGAPVEVTLLFNSKHGTEPLKRLCEVLADMECFVNSTCGLHVHLDVRHLGIDKRKVMDVARRLGRALPVLLKMQPKSRRNNSYCRPDVSSIDGDRYYAVNATAWQKFKTIEVRLHAGSVSYSKIANWISLLKHIAAKPNLATLHNLELFIDKLELPDSLIEYVESRLKVHAPEFLEQITQTNKPIGA